MHPAVRFYAENSTFHLKNKKIISKWIGEIIRKEGKRPKDIAFVFCDDTYLCRLNKAYLKRKTLTDIIAFDYCEGEFISGELYISIDRVRENAMIFKNPFINELYRVMAHGILHLTGYSDKMQSEKLDMRVREDRCLLLLQKYFKSST